MPLSHLLAAADGSEAGRHAFEIAQRLAGSLEARLSAMTVLQVGGEVPAFLASNAPFVGRGVPGVEIARRAEMEGVDLIVLGRGSDAACLPRLGSTADALVRRSRVPCLFVPVRQHELRRAVIAADGTDRGMAVLRYLPELSGLGVGQVEVCLVERDDRSPVSAGPPSARGQRVATALSAAGGGTTASVAVLRGDPVTTMLDALTDPGQTILVVGARRGGPSGTDQSSGVGRRLLYESPCAVLTVPI